MKGGLLAITPYRAYTFKNKSFDDQRGYEREAMIMTVEPKRQKRPYSYYEKTINEYSYRSMERVRKICPEKVEALLLRFPFDDSRDKHLWQALRRCRIYPGQGCYDDCYSAGIQAYLYSIHRCALVGYTNVIGYIAKMQRIYLICAIVVYRNAAYLCKEHGLRETRLEQMR